MRLIYVTAAMPFSLDETFIVPEVLELQRRGHEVIVVPIQLLRSTFHRQSRQLTTIGEPLLSLSVAGNALIECIRAPMRALRAVSLLARSRNARIFIKNMAVLPKGLWLARLARQRRIDHIHAHWAGTSATAALVASVVSGTPWTFTAHRWDIPENNLLYEKAQLSSFVRTIDMQGAEELTTFVGRHRQKLRVIHMGVTLHPLAPERRAYSEGPLRVIMGARFVKVKGHRYAVEAIAQLKAAGVDVLLECAGHGPLQAEIEKYARDLNVLDRVQFPGVYDHIELLNKLRSRRWHVALLPSIEVGLHKEGIPVFLLEAMAAGVPVVATSTGGIPELLEGGAGMLIPARNAAAIAEALASLAADCELRCQFADAGIRRIGDHFSVASIVSALLTEICRSGLRRRNRHE